MSDNPLKIVEVSGVIPKSGNTRFDYHLNSNYLNTNQGVWQVCVLNISTFPQVWSSQPPNFIEIKTNLVYGEYSQLFIRDNIPIQKVMILQSQNTLTNFQTPTWFQVNDGCQNFQVYIDRYGNVANDFRYEVKVIISFGFQRIR